MRAPTIERNSDPDRCCRRSATRAIGRDQRVARSITRCSNLHAFDCNSARC